MMDFGVVLQTSPPVRRVIDLAKRAEANGFTHVWVFDSHVLWQEPFIILSQILAATERVVVGPMVTNPGTRDWTVLASTFATLNDIYGPRTICGIGRGDSALRYIGRKPRTLAEMTEAMRIIKGLVAGKTVDYRGVELRFSWVEQGWDLPVWGAGYGPRALDCIGRNADGFVLQLADPQILEWTLGAVGEAAAAEGRALGSVATCVVAPAYVGDDLAHQREQLRWFGGMVGNHVADLVSRYGENSKAVPKALTDYIKGRESYDYAHHGQAGNPSTEFVPDDIVDRFCVVGRVEDHIAKLTRLRDMGADHFAIYLMHDAEQETLDAYGKSIIPVLSPGSRHGGAARDEMRSPRPAGTAHADSSRQPASGDKYERKGYSARSGYGTRPALLVVDFINGFTDPSSGVGRDYSAQLGVAAELLEQFRSRSLPVLFSVHVYEPDFSGAGPFLDKVPALEVLVRGSKWVRVDDRVRPQSDERVVEKKLASAFFGTMLDVELRSLGVDTVFIVGCTTSGNIRATALDSMQHGFRTLVVRDAVGDRAKEPHEANLLDIDAKYADVVSSEEIPGYLRELGESGGLEWSAREEFQHWWNSPSGR